jgi:hypothetical protein
VVSLKKFICQFVFNETELFLSVVGGKVVHQAIRPSTTTTTTTSISSPVQQPPQKVVIRSVPQKTIITSSAAKVKYFIN